MSSTNIFSKASSMFGSKGNDQSDSLDDLNPEETNNGSKFEKFKFWKKKDSIVESINNKISGVQERTENFQLGILMLIAGGIVICLSTLYLPLIAILPHKFCALFSIGSILCMVSLGLMMGTKNLFKKLFSKKMFLYSACYFLSIILGIYYSTIHKSYIFALLFVITQFVSLTYIIFSNIPYGKTTLNYIYKMIGKGCKICCGFCFKKGAEKLPLPF